MRINYWSHSKFAEWLRIKFGLTNPGALTSKGWREWKKESKKVAPFIHWLTDVAFDKAQDFFCWPKDKLWDLRCALNARYFDKYHSMPTGLNKWQYHEVDTRMLHGMFQTLVDFIEIEKAWMSVICGQEENQKEFGYSWWEMNGWTNWLFTEKRHPLAGIHHLKWEMELKKDASWYGECEEAIEEAKAKGEFNQPTPQALAAKEQFELYNWWKNVRPNRPDPYEASGYNLYFEILHKKEDDFLISLEDRTPDEQAMGKKCSESCHEIEAAYDKEDEEMLIRLIKVRGHLWT